MSGWIQMPDGHPGALGSATSEREQAQSLKDAAAKADPDEERKRRRSTAVLESEESSSLQSGILHAMPKRKTDSATAVARKFVLKQEVRAAECKTLQREGGVEKQYRMCCKSCGVPVCYQDKPFESLVSEVSYLYVIDSAVSLNPSVISLYWAECKDGKSLPACFKRESAKRLTVMIAVTVDCPRFSVKQFGDKMHVHCTSNAVGGDMTCANKEITKMLAAIVGCSRKQLSLTGVMLVVLDVEPVDVFRRLLCSMF